MEFSMSRKVRDFANPNNQTGVAITHSHLLSAINGMNNLWSALNNFKGGDEPEAVRSVVLAVFSITESLHFLNFARCLVK